jgi:hypothetical protein
MAEERSPASTTTAESAATTVKTPSKTREKRSAGDAPKASSSRQPSSSLPPELQELVEEERSDFSKDEIRDVAPQELQDIVESAKAVRQEPKGASGYDLASRMTIYFDCQAVDHLYEQPVGFARRLPEKPDPEKQVSNTFTLYPGLQEIDMADLLLVKAHYDRLGAGKFQQAIRVHPKKDVNKQPANLEDYEDFELLLEDVRTLAELDKLCLGVVDTDILNVAAVKREQLSMAASQRRSSKSSAQLIQPLVRRQARATLRSLSGNNTRL